MSKAQRQLQRQLAHIRSISPETVLAPGERFRYNVTDLAVGGVFRLMDRTYRVLAIGTYTETDESYSRTLDWTGHELKLACLETGAMHNMEWEADDAVAVALTLREVPFSELKYDDGEPLARDSDDLDEIVDKNWEIVCSGKSYDYEDDYAALYRKDSGDSGERVYFYAFEADDGEQLTVEAWVRQGGREDFQVFLSRNVPPDDIEVIVVGASDRRKTETS